MPEVYSWYTSGMRVQHPYEYAGTPNVRKQAEKWPFWPLLAISGKSLFILLAFCPEESGQNAKDAKRTWARLP